MTASQLKLAKAKKEIYGLTDLGAFDLRQVWIKVSNNVIRDDYQKDKKRTSLGEDVAKREPSSLLVGM